MKTQTIKLCRDCLILCLKDACVGHGRIQDYKKMMINKKGNVIVAAPILLAGLVCPG